MISFDEFLKQDECDKYNMLQECNAIIQQKENIIKEVREYIEEKDKEIERLIISLQAQEELTMNEHIKVERLNNIIKEVREYADKLQELKGDIYD